MKYIILLLFYTGSLFAAPTRHELTIDNSSLIYYLESPSSEETYPIIVALEGSYSHEAGPQSVLRLHKRLATTFINANIGLVTMERRGVDGDSIDINTFHKFNIPSQRLKDHIELVAYLRKMSLKNWNGKLIVLGGSEGGPIAIRLAHATKPEGCIAIVGCGDQSFKEYIWITILAIKASGMLLDELPVDRSTYNTLCDMMKANPDPTKFWFGQTYLYWADALDLTEKDEFLALTCPTLVIAGSEDIECESTDRLISQTLNIKDNVTYLRVEGMGHNALDPQWNILESVERYIKDKIVK